LDLGVGDNFGWSGHDDLLRDFTRYAAQ